jgi:hypothetical protein
MTIIGLSVFGALAFLAGWLARHSMDNLNPPGPFSPA